MAAARTFDLSPALLTQPPPTGYGTLRDADRETKLPPPPRVPHRSDEEAPVTSIATSVDSLGELHMTMSARLDRLQAVAGDLEPEGLRVLVSYYLRSARELRDRMFRLSMAPRVEGEDELTVSELKLAQALRWTYLWTIDQLDSLLWCCVGEKQPELASLEEIVSVCPEVFDPLHDRRTADLDERVTNALVALDEIVIQLVRKRDWIERSCGARGAATAGR